jgi:hypothetical protein
MFTHNLNAVVWMEKPPLAEARAWQMKKRTAGSGPLFRQKG